MLIKKNDSCLLLIDVQQKLLPFIYEYQSLIDNCCWLINIATFLKVPLLVSEQYPKGLGHTVEEIKQFIVNVPIIEKLHFSCVADPIGLTAIDNMKRNQIILFGIEAHVCVLQTALELKQLGKEVFVIADAISSRNPKDFEYAIRRFEQNNIEVVTREMVVFEWLHQSGTAEFKHISQKFLK